MAKKTSSSKKKTTNTTASRTGLPVNNVKIRMYCLGTGDCFVLRFCNDDSVEFTMMIDCGSCQGGPKEFKPYVQHLADLVDKEIDLLVITHEHNDHVNGFAKCTDIFSQFTIHEAWFAWTENPEDPTGAAKELQKKRSEMRMAFQKALTAIDSNTKSLKKKLSKDYYNQGMYESNLGILGGLNTLAEINLPAAAEGGKKGLPGMEKIKKILADKKVKVKYLNPGETVRPIQVNGVKFHVLGPPMDRSYIFKEGKEGVDVFKKKLSLSESSLAAAAFMNIDINDIRDLPFASRFVANKKKGISKDAQDVIDRYEDENSEWRKIDDDWLNSAGSLALRLNSHINNTSLVLAAEFDHSDKVLLLPGDAEYGNWESWYEIPKWQPKKNGDKHFVEELLNRTVFYKVGHHLSYNGTALEKGIMKMEHPELAAMATLDRNRISKGWKTTMPNKFLMQELIKRCKGKLFIMSEFDIRNAPSKTLDPKSLKKGYATEDFPDRKEPIYIEYTCKL